LSIAIAPLASDPLGDVEVEVELPILLLDPEDEPAVPGLVMVPECESLIPDELDVLGEVDELLPDEPDVLGDVIELLPVGLEVEPVPADSLWAYAGTKQAATPRASRVRRRVYFFIYLPFF
jgi:hypothetical protein